MKRPPIPDSAIETPSVESPVGDRSISPIGGRLGGRHGKIILLAALAVGSGVFLTATWNRGDQPADDQSVREAPPRELALFEPAARPEQGDVSPDPVGPSGPPTVPALEVEAPVEPDRMSSAPSPEERRRALAESARRAPVLAYNRPSNDATPRSVSVASDAANDPQTALEGLRRSGPIGQVRAGQLPDRNLMIAAGMVLPCVLQTAIDSTTPGYVSCVLPQDVWSESGSVVLLERGTRVLGEYQGNLQQGRRRLFVLWTRALTPTGVTISLASPASDPLGRAGFDGEIDGRFWDRFGGALLLSLVDGGTDVALGTRGDGSDASRRPTETAAVALEKSVDIPAVLRKSQGETVSIFVAQDLDFRTVYRLQAR